MDSLARRLFFVPAALVMSVGSALGYYLVRGEPAMKDLVVSGHVHGLLFALSAIGLYGLISQLEKPSPVMARWMGGLTIVTYLMPYGLMTAGFTGSTTVLRYTTGIGGGALILLWLVAAVLIAFRPKKTE